LKDTKPSKRGSHNKEESLSILGEAWFFPKSKHQTAKKRGDCGGDHSDKNKTCAIQTTRQNCTSEGLWGERDTSNGVSLDPLDWERTGSKACGLGEMPKRNLWASVRQKTRLRFPRSWGTRLGTVGVTGGLCYRGWSGKQHGP